MTPRILAVPHLLAGAGAVRSSAAPDFPFDRALLQRISPIAWTNIIPYGETGIDSTKLWTGAAI
ncbi:MAG: hypothetical protein OXN84_07370 [Albidovulum sp.]|nr:hypothetical protein [Albidovulum sp.]